MLRINQLGITPEGLIEIPVRYQKFEVIKMVQSYHNSRKKLEDCYAKQKGFQVSRRPMK